MAKSTWTRTDEAPLLATYETGDTFDQSSSRGFIDIYGLQSKLAAARDVRFGVNMGY